MSRTTGAGNAALPEPEMWEKCYYLKLPYKSILLEGTHTASGDDPSAENHQYLLATN